MQLRPGRGEHGILMRRRRWRRCSRIALLRCSRIASVKQPPPLERFFAVCLNTLALGRRELLRPVASNGKVASIPQPLSDSLFLHPFLCALFCTEEYPVAGLTSRCLHLAGLACRM